MNLCMAHGGDMADPSGGTDRVSALAAGLAERGHEVTLVVPDVTGAFPDRLSSVDIRPVDVGRDNAVLTAVSITRTAAAVATEQDARLQYEHSTLAGIAALGGQSGYVLDMHDLAHSRFDVVDSLAAPVLKRATAWLERRGVREADHIVTVSAAMREQLGNWGADPDSVTVVPNGYFPERVEPLREVEPVSGRVAFLGTLHPKVDVDTFGSVADLESVSEVLVIGDGAQRDAVERLAASRETVRYTGRLPDAEAFSLLAGAAVAINPQQSSAIQRSSSPVKLYYYAALGLPMVVTPGPPVVGDLTAADAAVEATGVEEFERAVDRLVTDEARREELAQNATAVAAEFGWDRRVASIDRVYERLPKTVVS